VAAVTRRISALAVLVALAPAGCGGDQARPAAKANPRPGGCAPAAAPKPKGEQALKASTARVPAGSTVTLKTNCGDLVVTLEPQRAPKTDAAFAGLVKQGFYDGLSFHRIVPGFVIQGGDPLGNGQGGPGYTVVEKPPSKLLYRPGVVAMAKTGTDPAGASGSQFFIVTGDQAESLPPDYALVGRLTRGMDVAKRIERIPASADGTPSRPIVIRKATVQTP
jgi:cyclophilin family peptidyl-prolyl cis-trans isomerase